ncbi:MAG: hypothetical protein GYB31_05770 [Bacteroidetes bacterium]|nr:hypothetical protein [Bacteroidota bacterium]
MKNSFWLIALLFSVALFQSCQKEGMQDDPAEQVAPEIPPMAMYSMPTDALEDTETDTTFAMANGMTYHNWFHSATHLVFWHTVVQLHMAVPTTAFAAALNQQAEYIGNGTFKWDYPYTAPPALGGATYYVVLTGQYQNSVQEVAWTMTVSQVGGFSDFVWYTGVTAVDESYASFTLNRFPNNPQPFVNIEHTKDQSIGGETTRFTNVIPGNPQNGQYIEYRISPGNDFNRQFDVQAEAGNYLNIQWNEPAGDGRVKHPFHYGDSDWHCWDTNQIDSACN